MKFDDSEAPKDGGTCPAAGTYEVECVGADARYGREHGTPYIALKLKIKDVPYHLYVNVMCAGKGAGIGKQTAKAFRVEVEDGEIFEDHFLGKRAVAHCIHDTYQGKRKLVVDIDQGEHCGFDLADDHDGDVGF